MNAKFYMLFIVFLQSEFIYAFEKQYEKLQEIQISGISTEGAIGVLNKYYPTKGWSYCEMIINVYGESGQSNYLFKVRSNKLIDATIKTYFYEIPIYVNPDVSPVLKRKITLNSHKKEVEKNYLFFSKKFNTKAIDKCY